VRKANICLLVSLLLFAGAVAWAQVRTVGQIVGVVQDPTGAVVPNAELTLTDEATGATRTSTSGADGGFVFIDLVAPATYKLTVTVPGFRTAVYPGLKVDVARTTNVTVTLEVGPVDEQVVVEAAATVLQTTSTAVESTVTSRILLSLPLNNRDVLDFVMLMPGAQQGGQARQSTFYGLPKGAINITMDGVNIQDNLLKSAYGGGMFTIIRPKLDNVEEITVTGASGSADSAGEGAVQIKFVTKRGTNEWHGSGFWYHRNNALNANSWFNNAAVPPLPPTRNLLNIWGVNVGGPVVKDKLFFFWSFEDFWLPEARTRENLLLTSEAASGIFRYRGTDGVVRTANLLALAGAVTFDCDPVTAGTQPCPSTIDPTVAAMLTTIAAQRAYGAVSPYDLFRDRLRWDAPTSGHRYFPTLRVDYHITDKIRWHAVGNFNKFKGFPDTLNSQDPTFPGLKKPAGGQYSDRWSLASTLNWQLRPSLSLELRLGRQRAPVQFFPENQKAEEIYPAGIRIGWPLVQSLHHVPRSPGAAEGAGCCRGLFSTRDTAIWNAGSNLGWVRGKHTFTFGTAFSNLSLWSLYYGGFGIPTVYTTSLVAGDPAAGAFTTTTLPAIALTPDLTNARALYALLAGRISSITGTRGIDEVAKVYRDRSTTTERVKQNEFGVYFTDSWRATTSFTLNFGLRWEYQGPPYNTNYIYTSPTYEHLWGQSGVGNLFKPGTLAGPATPNIEQRSRNLYKRSYKNFAPSLGFAWNPRFENAAWKAIFGAPGKSVFRAGYSIAYTREGMNHPYSYAGGNPGLSQSIWLSPGDVGFPPGGLLLRNPIPALTTFPTAFTFPMRQSLFTFSSGSFYSMDPNLKPPYVQSWTFGIQRELSPSTVLEVRYVGNRGTSLWRGYDLNEVNIFENGLLAQFRAAQTNLAICRANSAACIAAQAAAGVPAANRSAASFGNWGLAGQVPLPIFSAAFGALGPLSARIADWSSATFVTDLDRGEAGYLAYRLATSATYMCRLVGSRLQRCLDMYAGLVAGLYPANFFQVNPDAANRSVYLLTNGSFSTYHGLQIELRRRMARGLMITGNYTWSKSLTDLFADSATSTSSYTTLRNLHMDKGPSPWDLRHVVRVHWIYELPFGPGRKWSSGNSVVNKLLEGWEVMGVVAIQSGRVFRLTSGRYTVNGMDSGVIPKLTRKELQKLGRIVKPAGTPGVSTSYVYVVDPKLIGPDGRSNRAYLDVPTTPGEFGSRVFLYGPSFVKPDFSLAKKTGITERLKFEFRAEFFNAFNFQNFLIGTPDAAGVAQSIDSTTFGRTSVIFNDLGNQDQGPRTIQFVLRFSF